MFDIAGTPEFSKGHMKSIEAGFGDYDNVNGNVYINEDSKKNMTK